MNKNISILITFLLISSFLIPSVLAQSVYFPYYGKNKVIYKNIQWEHYKTEHFDIYYYVKNPEILKEIANMAESAYQQISQVLRHHLSQRVPLIYYLTSTDFEQTNLGRVSPGVLGFAEPILHRLVIRGDMTLDEMQNLIEHELTHIFEFDLLWGSPGNSLYTLSQPPLWIMEGFSEYNSKTWNTLDSLVVRDAVLNDRIPVLTEDGSLKSNYPMLRIDYNFGHAIYEFIEEKYGKAYIRNLWYSMKKFPRLGIVKKQPIINEIFDKDFKQFYHEFKKYLRNRYKDFFLRGNPEDYSLPIGPNYPVNPYFFNYSHTLSPSGEILATITINVKSGESDILLLSVKDGSVIKNITKGYTLKYEYIKSEIFPSKGRDLSWSDDGDTLAIFGRVGEKHSLILLDSITGKTMRKIDIPFDQPSSPCFFPGGKELLFAAFHDGKHDIFKINLSTEKTKKLTNDDLFEKAPTISPDGKLIAYTIHIGEYDKLFLSPANDLREKTQMTFGDNNSITPCFSPDSKKIYFSGDQRDAYNLYSLELDTGKLVRYTDVRTGNFLPTPLPSDSNKILFSSFNKSAFQVYISELEGTEEKTIQFEKKESDEEYERFEPILTFDINEKKISPYKGMQNFFLTSKPPVEALVTTDGSIFGGTSISFSDLFQDYTFTLSAYQVRTFRSYSFSFINRKRRLQYMASAFHYTIFYYPEYYYFDPTLYYRLSYDQAIATRKITGVSLQALYPLNKFLRLEAGLGFYNYEEDFAYLTSSNFGQFWNGNLLAASLAFVGETTRFKSYGPFTGNTFSLSARQSIPITSNFIDNTTLEADLRQYLYLGGDFLFATRLKGFSSFGENPFVFYYGGNNQVRSAYYYSIIANEGWYANIEFRFPVINNASTLIGQIGPVRGTIFFDMSRAKIKGYGSHIYIFDYEQGLLVFDALGSYGFGFQFLFLGLPVHIEFVKRIGISDISSPFDLDVTDNFETKLWIGFDF
ncbi:MAG: hypothetical protein ACOC6P_02510 [Candidatus Aminicenantaceae bacterium]